MLYVGWIKSLITNNFEEFGKTLLGLLHTSIPVPVTKEEGTSIGIWVVDFRIREFSSTRA